jgi:hypothetical protein
MQAINFTDSVIRYMVEQSGGAREKAPGKLPSSRLPESVTLPPRAYKASPGNPRGTVHFYVPNGLGGWTYAGSGTFANSSALVTLLGEGGSYRVEVAYPSSTDTELQDVKARQERRNADARSALLDEFGALTSLEVASRAGDTEAADLASRWKEEGRVFGVTVQERFLFPAFQFDSQGQPLPAIARVLEVLSPSRGEWPVALWFISASGWLGGRRPVDLLASEPDEVIEAALQEAAEFVF